ncbi:putative Rab-GTPase-TBC domain, EF-hand domain pair, Rab-GTPase-TBC domain superfamily [Plasmopara halstedii]
MRTNWFETSGARELRESSALKYHDYLYNSKHCSSTQFEEDLRQIELDLPRTGESIRHFLLTQDERNSLQEEAEMPRHVMHRFLPQLKNILLAYSVRNPRVGYVQGHADVLCFLLGSINEKKDEEEVFWVYASVIERVFPEDYFARAPKLHGFQVDCKLYCELVHEKLVPLNPVLSKIDLPFVTTLLSCKWFVSLWVGELPVPLLYEVWNTMLSEEDGTILHLLVALHVFNLALGKIQDHMEWDSSYIYKIILDQCQCATEIAPRALLYQARTTYGLKDESVEDMRAALRRLPPLREAEFAVLAKFTHFDYLEMKRLHDEFTFLRFQKKKSGRSKLRGLRHEQLENIFSRIFKTLPVDIYGQIYRLLRPDGYGNVSYYSLVQFLSVVTLGAPEEKAHLLFQIANHQSCDFLNQQDIAYLADLMCCLLLNQIVASGKEVRIHEYGFGESIFDAAKSPLLRRHFRNKLMSLVSSDGPLQYSKWLELAFGDSEIAQLMAWYTIPHQPNDFLGVKSRSWNFSTLKSLEPVLRRVLSDSIIHQPQQQRLSKGDERGTTIHDHSSFISRNKGINSFGLETAPFLKKTDIPARERRPHVTLLSKKMHKKFQKFQSCWPHFESGRFVRNPINESTRQVCSNVGSFYNIWCQCTLS